MYKTTRQLFFEHLAQTSSFPLALAIERAEGCYMYGTDGKRYTDMISGIAVSNVGHCHPKVVEAIRSQSEKYLHLMVFGEYVQAPQVMLAEALCKTLQSGEAEVAPFGPIDNVYFTNSGAEAIEAAMKLAKRFTGRRRFISCENAYHGATQGALSLAGAAFFKQNFRPLIPGTAQIRFGHMEDLQKIGQDTAALVIEVIGGESGVRLPSREYLRAARNRCTETGTLMIIDEVQTGFGRTGTFWAFEDFGIYPDILVCAKGMGGGMPIGAMMASKDLMTVLSHQPVLGHITTFGGHPVCCAASLAALQVILEEDLPQKAIGKGALIKASLTHPLIREIRGKGLQLAAEFDSFERLKQVIDDCINEGVVTDWFLFCDNSMRLAPPLTISEQEIEETCATIVAVLNRQQVSYLW